MRKSLVIAMLLVSLVACDGSRSRDSIQGSPSSPSPSLHGTPSSSASAKPIRAPKGWKTFSFQRVAFAYPPVPGKVVEASGAPSAPRHAWTIRRSDACDPLGNCRTYEFAAVNDACPVSHDWPTFAHRWLRAGSGDLVSVCDGSRKFAIDPIRVVTRPDGLKGVIYDANVWFPKKGDVMIEGALAAVLNFPSSLDKHYDAIAFYFDDPTPLDTIEQVLRLVTLG